MTDICTQVARYLGGVTFDSLPEAVVERAKAHILDTVGVMLAGVGVESSVKLRESGVLGTADRGQTVVGTSLRAPAPLAALANGVSAHALDYDDTNFVIICHTSGSSLSSLLALGEADHLSGKSVLTALVAGYEAAVRLGAAIIPSLYLRGWHATGVLGAMCATSSASHLLGLDTSQTTNALGTAASMASGLRANFGSHTKAMHMGNAAQVGVEASLLARAGFTSSSPVLEHHYGFYAATVGKDQVNLDAARAALAEGDRWYFVDPGIGIKLHPCNSAVLPGIDTTLELVSRHGITPDQVERVDYLHTDLARTIVPFDDPKTSAEAMYSMTHAIAAAVVYGRAGIQEFSEEAVHDPEVARMRKRVQPAQHPDFVDVADGHDAPASQVTIHLKDGRAFGGFRRRPRAYPGGEPLTREALLDKFRECAATRLSYARAQEVIETVDALEGVSDVAALAAALRAP